MVTQPVDEMMKPIRLQLPPPLPRPRSQRSRVVARWFGLQHQTTPSAKGPPGSLDIGLLFPGPGELTLITGASGSGKSSLLKAIRKMTPRETILDLNRIRLPGVPVIDCLGPAPVPRVMRLLSRVGLSEAWTCLRTPDELSEGQRWRLRLAIAIRMLHERPGAILVADEFAALLDRVTAAVIARTLHRAVHALHARAIVATSHDDLAHALAPTRIVTCDFGDARITPGPSPIRRRAA